MPKWTVDSVPDKNPTTWVVIAAIAIVVLIFSVATFRPNDLISYVNIVADLSLLAYSGMKIYIVLTQDHDFVKITADGVIHRSTSPYSFLIPKITTIKFSQIKTVDLVKFSSQFNQKKKKTAILLHPYSGKQQIIGANLSEAQQNAVLLALKGSVKFSHALQTLFGPDANVDTTIKNVVASAKEAWKSLQNKQ